MGLFSLIPVRQRLENPLLLPMSSYVEKKMRRWKVALLIAAVGLAAACTKDPQKLKVRYLASGDNYVAQKKYGEAIVEYRNAVAQDGQYGEARFKLAETYERTGDLRNALREYVRAAD